MKELMIKHHHGDLPDDVTFGDSVAVDTEAMGLKPHRDRLCVVQLSGGDGVCHVVQVNRSDSYHAPNLCRIFKDPKVLKLFHFARFDVGILQHTFKLDLTPVYCTKIASKIARTLTDKHGLKDLCHHLLGVDISKEQQTSDWGSPDLTDQQLRYAATDVLYLHDLKEKLDVLLKREKREHLAQACFDFLPTCAKLDLSEYGLKLFEH